MSRRISGAVFWGLVFVAFGTLFLARNLGYPVPLWTVVARYWPVLLIVWGIFKLADALRAEPGEKRSLFSGGDVAAIVLVIVFGSLITLAADMNPDLGKIFNTQNFDVWDITGNNFTFTEHHVLAVGANPAIEVEGNFGDVEVAKSDSNEIALDVSKTIRAADQAEGERLSTSFVYSIADISGNGQNKYKIAANSSRRYKAALTIRVPASSNVSVENRNGAVTIRGIDGNQEITNRFGDVEVQGVKGRVKIQNRNGTVHVENIGDSVTISNSFGPVNVANVRGELKINGRNNEIDIEHVDKDIDVESAFQNVDIDDAKGAVKVKSRNGEVSVRLLQHPTRDVTIESQFGDVNIDIPEGSAFSADARSRFGGVHSDFPQLQTNSHNADHSLNGQVGTGGPAIKVESRNGEIRITKKGSVL